jgi:peptidoglycan/xylan/chitin deacetylase (PgdA/CDA1 family)
MSNFASSRWKLIGKFANMARLEEWGTADRWLAVLFHHITDNHRWRSDDPLVCGLSVDISAQAFKERVCWLKARYEIVSLDDVLSHAERGRPRSGRQKLLICFDDGYASVLHLAAPVLKSMNIPWALFINPAFVGNNVLPIDNIVSYIANLRGTGPLMEVAGESMVSSHVFIGRYLSTLPPNERRKSVENLAAKLGIDTVALAQKSRLFLEEGELRELASSGVEIGNHTFDHVHGRSLDSEAAEFQIGTSARKVETMSGRPVRAFAYPYGAVQDATPIARLAVKNSGHACAFVVQNRANTKRTDPFSLFRVDLGEMDDSTAAFELEILPRLRAATATVCSWMRL